MHGACAVLRCHLLPVRPYRMIPHHLINGTIFEEKKAVEYKMCVLVLSKTFVSDISDSENKLGRYIKCT